MDFMMLEIPVRAETGVGKFPDFGEVILRSWKLGGLLGESIGVSHLGW
jgi:hypothetical protein